MTSSIASTVLAAIVACLAAQVGRSGAGDAEMTSNAELGITPVEEVGRVYADGVRVAPLATPGTTIVDRVAAGQHARARLTTVRLPVGPVRAIGATSNRHAGDPPLYAVTGLELRVDGCAVDMPIAEPPALSDPHGALLERRGRAWTLSIWGSDADETYRLTYRFDDKQVRSRRIDFGGTEEATYRLSPDRYGEPRDCGRDVNASFPSEARRPDAVLLATH